MSEVKEKKLAEKIKIEEKLAGREPLNRIKKKITLTHFVSGGTEAFTVHSMYGEPGGACLCYSVSRNGVRGLLKEFYPRDFRKEDNPEYNILKRKNNGQLVADGDAYIERFAEYRQEFIEGYRLLEELRDPKRKSGLTNFLPTYEIYVGTEQNSTAYIWTPEGSGLVFEKYIESVWKNPARNAALKLHDILCSVKTLADCVLEMHKKGLLHRDIAPGNFMILNDARGDINPHNVLMFDINSFARATAKKYEVGTEGFMAPEVREGGARRCSDVYSIGALLFYAIVDGETKYSTDKYEEISDAMNNSKLLSEVPDVKLNELIRELLYRTLETSYIHRWETLDDVVKYLDMMLDRLIPYKKSRGLDVNERITIIDKVKPIKAKPIFQDLLYKVPVYEYCLEEKAVNIMVLGSGTYGQMFMDTALQVMQIKGKQVYITAFSDSEDQEKSEYLAKRPDMERFFEINKTGPMSEDCYGRVNFKKIEFKESKQKNREHIRELLTEYKPCYVLVSLGDDKLNAQIAELLAEEKQKADAENEACATGKLAINYVWSSDDCPAANKEKGLTPVCINGKVSYSYKKIDERLTRMAFNTHLVWNDSAKYDINELEHEFKKQYNYNSSMSFALAVPYKLWSMKKSLGEVEKNLSLIQGLSDAEIREAAYYEHRRWVTEKVCDGYRAPLDKDGKPDASVCDKWKMPANKNEAEKFHFCIAKGTRSKTPKKDTWDKCDIEKLDELDRISVVLYRKFKNMAQSSRAKYPIDGRKILGNIHSAIAHDNAVLISLYNEYADTLEAIIYGENTLYSNKFDALHKRFKKAVEDQKPDSEKTIIAELDRMEKLIKPIVLFRKKADYKATDEDLIRSLAYIIGHKPRPKLAMIFEDGRFSGISNDRLFRNVVSSTIIIPKLLTYFYYYTPQTDVKQFIKAAKGIISYFDSKEIKTAIEFVLISAGEIPEELIGAIEGIETGRMLTVRVLKNEESIDTTLHQEFKEYDLIDITNLPYATVVENSRFICAMSDLPYFEIDPATGDFLNVSGCEHLNSINKKGVSMMIKDIFALRDVKSRSETSDMRGIYKELWKVYTGNYIQDIRTKRSYGVKNWTELTKALSDYEKSNGILVKYEKPQDDSSTETKKFERILPIECYNTVMYLLKELKEQGFIEKGNMNLLSVDSIRVVITYCSNGDSNPTPKLFSDYESLQKKLITNVYYQGKYKVMEIRNSSLEVKDIVISQYAYSCLEAIAKKGYVILNDKGEPIVGNNNGKDETTYKVSFTYAFAKIKDILTVGGSILELHTYYSVLDNPEFDDVGLSVVAQTGQFENEFDLIITKGLRSVFVECKARKQLEQGFYHKLSSLAGLYGINCTPIIVSNEYSNHLEGIRIVNSEQKARGDELGIITISEISEIDNISDVIMGIINPDKE